MDAASPVIALPDPRFLSWGFELSLMLPFAVAGLASGLRAVGVKSFVSSGVIEFAVDTFGPISQLFGAGGIEIVNHSDASFDGGISVSGNTGTGVLAAASFSVFNVGGKGTSGGNGGTVHPRS